MTEDSSTSSDELLAELLGGISFEGEWQEEIVENDNTKLLPGLVPSRHEPALPHNAAGTTGRGTKGSLDVLDRRITTTITQPSQPQGDRPPVQVTYLGEDRGFGLVATTSIPRGTVIYIEQAACATQVSTEAILACQHCFRSLEPITKLSDSLPHPEFWPVPALVFEDSSSETSEIDRLGRRRCRQCGALFCTQQHYTAFLDNFGSCCKVTEAQKAAACFLEESNVFQASVVLAARLFLHSVHYYRQHNQSIRGHFMEDYCGTPDNIQELELGARSQASGEYSLETLYGELLKIAELTPSERESLSLELLHGLAAKSARNGVGILTQSPFKPYYSSLLRSSESRDSEQHKSHMQQLARALGYDHLVRGMDREIDASVAPELCAVFPLTARCNHSCDPNAEVRNQEFVDHYIDVVSKRDIAAGEELCISYIGMGPGVGRKTTSQRRRELQAKYLFFCQCSRCNP